MNYDIFRQHVDLCAAIQKVLAIVRCKLCDVEFEDHSKLRQHINDQHAAVFQMCNLCSFFTEIPEDFVSHSDMHLFDHRICKICNLVFESTSCLNEHIDATHIGSAEEVPSCLVCHHQEADEDLMKEHVQSHSCVVFPCDVEDCVFKSMLKSSFELHNKYFHGVELETSTAQIKVEDVAAAAAVAAVTADAMPCNTFRPEAKPMAHLSTKPQMTGTFSCPICIERPPFRYKKSFDKHISQHAVDMKTCSFCKEKFLLQSELQIHMNEIHGMIRP